MYSNGRGEVLIHRMDRIAWLGRCMGMATGAGLVGVVLQRTHKTQLAWFTISCMRNMATRRAATSMATIPACRRLTKVFATQREAASLVHTSTSASKQPIWIPQTSQIRVANDTYSLFKNH